MSKEYIEREAFINWVKEFYPNDKHFLSGVINAPTADVAEVKHGKWVERRPNPKAMDEFHKMGIGKAMNRNSIYWTCSCCGNWGTPVHNYCSNCGAKMDKE